MISEIFCKDVVFSVDEYTDSHLIEFDCQEKTERVKRYQLLKFSRVCRTEGANMRTVVHDEPADNAKVLLTLFLCQMRFLDVVVDLF